MRPIIAILILVSPCGVAASSVYRTPLSEAGQSGICLYGDRLFLTVHSRLQGPMNGGFYFSGSIEGQCFDKTSGKLLWTVSLPGSWRGKVLESWHDSTSLLPVADESHVIFHNLNGMLACCTHDGRLIWSRSWQAPDPDIKNCRMFLRNGQLIVALPSDTIAVPASKEHPELPFYRIHSINVRTGKDTWISPVLISHATQYSLDVWKNRDVIVASLIDLSHWKFRRGRHGYLISLEDGQPLVAFDLPAAIPHQKNQLSDGKFLVTAPAQNKTRFQLIDPDTSRITDDFSFEKPDAHFEWSGERYVKSEFRPEFTDRTLRGKGQPTPSTVHSVGSKIYFWRYDCSRIGCIDTRTGSSVLVQVPIQSVGDQTVWNRENFRFTKGVLNSRDQVINRRVGSIRGIERGGFGHTNPAWPVRFDGQLFWQGGAGLLYVIDLSQPFSPNTVSWLSIEQSPQSWTFGEPAIDASSIYIRSQRELIKFER